MTYPGTTAQSKLVTTEMNVRPFLRVMLVGIDAELGVDNEHFVNLLVAVVCSVLL